MRVLAALLIGMMGIAPARAEITIPISEEIAAFIAIPGGIGLAIYFIYRLIKFRRWIREDEERRRLRPEEFEARAPLLTEKQKSDARLKEAGEAFIRSLKKAGYD
jgi:hypothetical protein